MHNQFPTQQEKLTLFYQLLRSEWTSSNICWIAILPNGRSLPYCPNWHCPLSSFTCPTGIANSTYPFTKIVSVSWCLPLIATAVFQTAIITLGAKSQKVQAGELFQFCPYFLMQVCLQESQVVQLEAETSAGLQWTFLFLLPFAIFIYPTIYIYILLIRQLKV